MDGGIAKKMMDMFHANGGVGTHWRMNLAAISELWRDSLYMPETDECILRKKFLGLPFLVDLEDTDAERTVELVSITLD